MPFFEYRGTDAQGRSVVGTVSAVDARAALGRLVALGVADAVLIEGAAPSPVRPSASRSPVVLPRPESPIAAPSPSPTSTATPTVPIASPLQRFFFFERLHRYLASGFALPQALAELAKSAPSRSRGHIEAAGVLVSQGTELGDALAGGFVTEAEADALRAASRGGYLPEATARLAELATNAHRAARFGAYPAALIGIALALFPVTPAIMDASFRTMARQDAAGGTLPPSTIVSEGSRSVPLALLLGAGLLLLAAGAWRGWLSPPFRPLRHRLGAKLPAFASRARSESLAQIAFHLSRLSAAGVSPAEAARLAARTPPNLLHRADAVARLGSLPTGTRVSEALARSPLVSDAYRHLVETGELTGDVPGALDRVATIESSAEGAKREGARRLGATALLLLAGLLGAVYLGTMATKWYGGIIKMFTADPTEPLRAP